MAKTLKFEKHTTVVRDNDGDAHDQDVTSAVVDADTAGQEVFLRDGSARVLRAGDVVVPAGAGKHDVFTAKEWADTWNDDERVEDHGGAIRSQDVADDNKSSHQGSDGLSTFDDSDRLDDQEVSEFRAWKLAQQDKAVADDNDERPQDTVPNAPKDDVAPSAPAKKAASSSGKRG